LSKVAPIAFAMVLPDEETARQGFHVLQELQTVGSLTMHGTDVLQRGADGGVSILRSNRHDFLGAELDAVAGALLVFFGGPVDAALGATAGRWRDLVQMGVNGDFLNEVERYLTPGKFAVVGQISESAVGPLDERMAELRAQLVRGDGVAFEEDVVETSSRGVPALGT